MEVYEMVREFILQDLSAEGNSLELDPKTPLADAGLLDSMSALRLLSFLEETFNVELEASDVEEGGFVSLSSIETMVMKKMAARG